MHSLSRRSSILIGVCLAAASAASKAGLASETSKRATLEKIPGSDLTPVVLTRKAAQRLAITTAKVRERPGQRRLMIEGKDEVVPTEYDGKLQKVIPYSAVIYDREGNTWIYTNPKPLVFVRVPIDVEFIKNRRAFLREGPAVGIEVVTAGAAALLEIEQESRQ